MFVFSTYPYRIWVAKSVARQLATAVLWVRIQTSLKNQKSKMGDKSEGVADTLKPAKKKYTIEYKLHLLPDV